MYIICASHNRCKGNNQPRIVDLVHMLMTYFYLDPYRKFKIFVKAFNAKNEGNASEDIQVFTLLSYVAYDYIYLFNNIAL